MIDYGEKYLILVYVLMLSNIYYGNNLFYVNNNIIKEW